MTNVSEKIVSARGEIREWDADQCKDFVNSIPDEYKACLPHIPILQYINKQYIQLTGNTLF